MLIVWLTLLLSHPGSVLIGEQKSKLLCSEQIFVLIHIVPGKHVHLIPHFHIVKLGYDGVYLYFLFLL